MSDGAEEGNLSFTGFPPASLDSSEKYNNGHNPGPDTTQLRESHKVREKKWKFPCWGGVSTEVNFRTLLKVCKSVQFVQKCKEKIFSSPELWTNFEILKGEIYQFYKDYGNLHIFFIYFEPFPKTCNYYFFFYNTTRLFFAEKGNYMKLTNCS